MVGGQKLDSAHCNFSHQDQIWKDYVKKERDTSMKRDKDYSFLVQEYRTLRKDILELRANRRQGLQSLPSSSSSAPKLTEDVDKPENKEQTNHPTAAAATENDLKLPPLDAPHQDTSNPFPLVTSREIGWRAGKKYNLEVYGRWGKPKYSIINQLKWPNDAVP